MDKDQNSKVKVSVVEQKQKVNPATEDQLQVESHAKENLQSEDQPPFNFHSQTGDTDPLGRRIDEIYFTSDNKYFIYHTSNFRLKIIAKDGTLMSRNLKVNQIYVQIMEYLSTDPALRKKYNRTVAFAVKTLYEGDLDVAVQSLESTYNNIIRSLQRKAETAYLGGAFLLVLIALISYFVTYKVGDLNSLGHIIFSAVVISSLGGFLSVSLNVKNLEVDVQHSQNTIMAYGAQRIFLAMISGVFIYFLILSKIFLAFFQDLGNLNIYYVAFFLCGFI